MVPSRCLLICFDVTTAGSAVGRNAELSSFCDFDQTFPNGHGAKCKKSKAGVASDTRARLCDFHRRAIDCTPSLHHEIEESLDSCMQFLVLLFLRWGSC